ncbi:hypothetical protein Agub_g4113 [Astrephomene gubernaculifera]|uniref:Leucine zipper transcription factor-like protein 1 n=1 Tax=Astrephomene gubernaculifera TaxID=47775 RepID=A0AAD3DLS2_9CHLO|nr:hypothetical protein Agub_g4113 [Astrephomene gubernaculifera]
MSIALSDEAELQVQGYLRFANLKREQHVREVVSTISDFKSSRIREGEMYNFRELLALFSELEQEARQLIEKEIQDAYHTNALLVKLLLGQAQAAGVELAVDTNQLENEFLLKQAARNQVALQEKELRAASEAAAGKLADSKQFTQMKALMQAKSQEVAALRKRLEKYEPHNVPSADTA